jgi:hypothetical protein
MSTHDVAPADGPDIATPAGTAEAGTSSPPARPRLAALVFAAADSVGEDDKGRGGIAGYMRRLAIREPRVFASLLTKALDPGEGADDGPLQATFHTFYQRAEH